MSFEDVMPLDIQQLDCELENMTDRGSSEPSDQELEAIPDLETVRSKVGRVVWIYPRQHISLRSVEGISPASPKLKLPTFTQSTAPSLRIPLQERNQAFQCAEKAKPRARGEHKEWMVRARKTVWEGRLRNDYGVSNCTGTSRSFISKFSKPPGVRKGRNIAATPSSAPQRKKSAGQGSRHTAAALAKGSGVDMQSTCRQDNLNHKSLTAPAIYPTKPLQRGRPLGVVKSKRSGRKARVMGRS